MSQCRVWRELNRLRMKWNEVAYSHFELAVVWQHCGRQLMYATELTVSEDNSREGIFAILIGSSDCQCVGTIQWSAVFRYLRHELFFTTWKLLCQWRTFCPSLHHCDYRMYQGNCTSWVSTQLHVGPCFSVLWMPVSDTGNGAIDCQGSTSREFVVWVWLCSFCCCCGLMVVCYWSALSGLPSPEEWQFQRRSSTVACTPSHVCASALPSGHWLCVCPYGKSV